MRDLYKAKTEWRAIYVVIGLLFFQPFHSNGTDYYSISDAAWDLNGTWSYTGHNDPGCGANPGCLTGSDRIFVNHQLTASCLNLELAGITDVTCQPGSELKAFQFMSITDSSMVLLDSSIMEVSSDLNLSLSGDVQLKNHAVLIIHGDLVLSGNSQLEISENSLLIINGDLSTSDDVRVNIYGEIRVEGDVAASGNSEINLFSDAGYINGDVDEFENGQVNFFGGPLPVDFASFTATLEHDQVTLNWVTLTELNNDHFQVQRSRDGQNFESIQRVSGAGNSNSRVQYRAVDEDPFSGLSYYRLKQVDMNGEFEYSDLVAIEFVGKKDNEIGLGIFPNPASEQIMINLAAFPNETLDVNIYNSNGSRMIRKQWGTSTEKMCYVSVSHLPSGVYWVKVSDFQLRKLVIE